MRLKILFIIFGFVFPLILAIALFWIPAWTKIGVENIRDNGGNIRVLLVKEPDFLQILRDSLQSPFNLSQYKLCLRNSTKVKGAGGETYLATKVVIVDEEKNIQSRHYEIPANGKICIDTNTEYPLIGVSGIQDIKIEEQYLPAKIDYAIDIAAKEAYPTRSSKIISSFLFILAYGAILKLSVEYINWFKRVFKKIN